MQALTELGSDFEEFKGAVLSGMKRVRGLTILTAALLAVKEEPLATIESPQLSHFQTGGT